eukprot:166016-Lingulodinium_polyedra.AAC.1
MEASQPDGALREAVSASRYTGFADICAMLRKTLLDGFLLGTAAPQWMVARASDRWPGGDGR